MPVPLSQILEETQPLPDQILAFLRGNAGMTYTLDELREGLGHGELQFTSLAQNMGQALLGLAADIVLADLRSEEIGEKISRYESAMLQLVASGRVSALWYQAQTRYIAADGPAALGAGVV